MPAPHDPSMPSAEPAPQPPPKHGRELTIHSARIVAPLGYVAAGGRRRTIPEGPCLIEKLEGPVVEIIWGASGQNCTALALGEVESAEERGHLVLLD